MNKSNLYIFIYSTIMVVLVAAVLSLAATMLKPYQQKNEEIARKLDILRSVDKGLGAAEADSKNDYVEAEYEKYIKESLVVGVDGHIIEGLDAFGIDIKKELAKAPEAMELPVFICIQDDGSRSYIFPVFGTGLWGPLWGYVALGDDFNTITGVVFDHKAETPGLGAEINTREFQTQFVGKKIFNDQGEYVSVMVNKPNQPGEPKHTVDAISGGTITSKGLEAMLVDCLKNYVNLIKSLNTLLP